MHYFWIRVYDYCHKRDAWDKGILLDEYYLKNVESKDIAKEDVKKKYTGSAAEKILFAKPRKKDGIYAIIMESNKFFYDRFYLQIDTYCFHCHKKLNGKASDFPKSNLTNNYFGEIDLEDQENTAYFCSYDCKNQLYKNLRYEGEFQEKEAGNNGDTFGYIYLMYNRVENKYYIGQTRYLPFFRWQEHIKDGGKGNIEDITFSVITGVRNNIHANEAVNQENLNNAEAWWIHKYKEEGYEVFNIANPKLTLEAYKQRFKEMIAKEHQVAII
ncbi:GIY-YIG nuclease family protein [Clostridium cellulovorans]|uniref:Excinuclease ABC C subunit domain protein n=1 Tax=Clostridium cellulovorans (strain ATCC 35296 / DSM 3052 / OCM 3 / 743B) TaxID=573061 RepID=D9SWE8_CLOC7|nr:GIY-YIG nuclease family protein [Clostridium cellulovorans]ADL53230.1 Excinuclease ABC C subunit domain protein [Clostridium cellulovorans 743B]